MSETNEEPRGLEERLKDLTTGQPLIEVADGFEVEVDTEYFTEPDQPE